MNQKYIVSLTPAEQKQIQEIGDSQTLSTTVRKRARILLLADSSAGKPMRQDEMAARCGVTPPTVTNTLRDYCTYGPEYTLKYRRTKVTNPPIVTGEIEARIVALACGEPPQGFCKWTVRLLTEKVVELDILGDVSRETVRRTLKKRNLSLT